MRVLDAEAMREVDRFAIEELGVPSLVLMENAAIGLADAIGEGYPEASSAAIFCGPGNNGGDGLALARHLTSRGYEVEIILMTGGGSLTGDASVQMKICENLGLPCRELDKEDSTLAAVEAASRLDLVVDALFGTGLSRPLAGGFAELVNAINALPIPCLAVDLPSGLNGSTPEIMGPHIQSELTVTFAAPKIAHVLAPAAEAVGDVVIADLGVPAELIDNAPGGLHLVTAEDLEGVLAPRAAASHKGDFGHALILAGSVGKSGAAILAARGAVGSGAGLVTVATPEPIVPTVELGSLESMTLPLAVGPEGGLRSDNTEAILDFCRGKQVLAMGPGLGVLDSTVELVRELVRSSETPIVLDADGLNAFAGAADLLTAAKVDMVLTPHPGELARLMGVDASEIQADRLASARSAARLTGCVVVLKGFQTLVAEPSGRVFVNSTGNPGMASGGTGDVLTGILTGFLSQGLDTSMAACLGVYLHGLAGDLATSERGQLGLRAEDLLTYLPAAVQELES